MTAVNITVHRTEEETFQSRELINNTEGCNSLSQSFDLQIFKRTNKFLKAFIENLIRISAMSSQMSIRAANQQQRGA